MLKKARSARKTLGICGLCHLSMKNRRKKKPYLRCRRHVPGFAGTKVDPESTRWGHKSRKSTDARIQIVEFHVWLTWKWNIGLHNSGKRPRPRGRGWTRPKTWTSSWKMETLHLEIDPFFKAFLQSIVNILLYTQWVGFSANRLFHNIFTFLGRMCKNLERIKL